MQLEYQIDLVRYGLFTRGTLRTALGYTLRAAPFQPLRCYALNKPAQLVGIDFAGFGENSAF